jgi:hypothetical protein
MLSPKLLLEEWHENTKKTVTASTSRSTAKYTELPFFKTMVDASFGSNHRPNLMVGGNSGNVAVSDGPINFHSLIFNSKLAKIICASSVLSSPIRKATTSLPTKETLLPVLPKQKFSSSVASKVNSTTNVENTTVPASSSSTSTAADSPAISNFLPTKETFLPGVLQRKKSSSSVASEVNSTTNVENTTVPASSSSTSTAADSPAISNLPKTSPSLSAAQGKEAEETPQVHASSPRSCSSSTCSKMVEGRGHSHQVLGDLVFCTFECMLQYREDDAFKVRTDADAKKKQQQCDYSGCSKDFNGNGTSSIKYPGKAFCASDCLLDYAFHTGNAKAISAAPTPVVKIDIAVDECDSSDDGLERNDGHITVEDKSSSDDERRPPELNEYEQLRAKNIRLVQTFSFLMLTDYIYVYHSF